MKIIRLLINRLKRIRRKFAYLRDEIVLYLFGKKWKIILINEYPKCGGSWLKRMIGYVLKDEGYFVNPANHKVPPIGEKFIIQRHWLKHTKNVFKAIVLLRDPRDAYNSFFFHENYYNPTKKSNKLYSFCKTNDEKVNMYNYLKKKFHYPELSTPGFSYKEFWDKHKNCKHIYFIKYEDLRNNTSQELSEIIEFLGFNKDKDLINEAVDYYDFKKVKKREKISDPRKRQARKGKVGDWRNNLNKKSKELIKKNFGDMIMEMGYEKDNDW